MSFESVEILSTCGFSFSSEFERLCEFPFTLIYLYFVYPVQTSFMINSIKSWDFIGSIHNVINEPHENAYLALMLVFCSFNTRLREFDILFLTQIGIVFWQKFRGVTTNKNGRKHFEQKLIAGNFVKSSLGIPEKNSQNFFRILEIITQTMCQRIPQDITFSKHCV